MSPTSWPRGKSGRPTKTASASNSLQASSGSTCTRCASPWRRRGSSISMSRRPIEVTMHLRTLLGDYPCTAALKNGSVKSDLVDFDFVEYSPTNKGFKPMVREGAFDVSEMAIVTYLIAKSFGKPMVLLPNVVLARFQHPYALYNAKQGTLNNAKQGTLKPADLNG